MFLGKKYLKISQILRGGFDNEFDLKTYNTNMPLQQIP
jgi:hypothetical protein